MKGQVEVLTTLLIMAVSISVVTSVYFFGLPLIEKNKDISVLQQTEDFIKNLNNKIKSVANGGSDQADFNLPGLFSFDSDTSTIQVKLKTAGTIYAEGGAIPMVYNTNPVGMWGVDEPEIIQVTSQRIEKIYTNIFELKYKKLKASGGCYQIRLFGKSGVTGEGHRILIKYSGVDTVENDPDCDGKDLIRTNIEISII